MSGADYAWCPICDCKAAYDGDDTLDGFVVLHGACWEALRGALDPELREAIQHIQSVGLTLPPAQVITQCLEESDNATAADEPSPRQGDPDGAP